jgi:phenylalanyl-tRNA synthetase beta chain
MKFSLDMANQFSNVDLKGIPQDELLIRMGTQLGAIEDTKDWSKKYTDIVIAKVISCEKHPNADKLSLCMIDDGGVSGNVERNQEGYVQVVCGANNVEAGILVAWIPPGATVPSTYNDDPFVLDARELRGKISNGMIASPKELDISDEHEGILIIDEKEAGRELKPGEKFSSLYGLDDFVVDCENKMFTHRPDCFGNLGIAREIAGIFDEKFESPNWYLDNPVFNEINDIELDVKNEISELVPRFSVVVLKNVKYGKSPIWMQSYLKRVGIKPINNIVDVTNYVMHLTGQPLHAFDYDKLVKVSDSPSLMPRLAKKGEKLTILGGKTIELSEEDMVIATDKQSVALAGVMGGAETEIDENTKTIVVECANFDMYSVRRTSMRHGLFTDAVTRFNKGQSPLQNDRVMKFAMQSMSEYAGAEQASKFYDLHSFDLNVDNLNHVSTNVEFINSRLGSSLSSEDIKVLLENVEFVVSLQGNDINITAPFWRMDISIPEDIVEEVGRLYGFDKLEVELPKRSTKPSPKNERREFKNDLRNKLSGHGASEVLTYSFVHGKLLENSNIDPEKWAYHLRNALSPDLQYYRPSLIPSLLNKVNLNIRAQAGDSDYVFALYEIGKAHVKEHFEEDESTLPKQMRRLSFVVAADNKSSSKLANSAFYTAKKYLELITNSQVTYQPLDTTDYPITSPYQKERSAVITMGDDMQPIGVIGEFQSKVSKSLKLPEFCAGFELDIDLLNSLVEHKKYQPLSQFPSSSQDITFEISEDKSWSELDQLIEAELAVAKAELGYSYRVTPLDIFQGENSDKKRISFRIAVTHHHKTLKTTEVSALLDSISKEVHEKLQATRI